MNNFVITSSDYSFKNYGKITHFIHFTNLNGFYFYNSDIYNFIFKILKDYLRKYYRNNVNLCVLIFEYNKKNNTYSLLSDINQIEFNPYSKDKLNFIINKTVVSGKKDIVIVVKEI
jgi:hypothetical protein